MKIAKTIFILFFAFALQIHAEDGSRLWLPSEANEHAKVSANNKNPTIDIAVRELQTQWKGAPVQLVLDIKKSRDPDCFTSFAMTKKDEGYSISGKQSKKIIIKSSSA